MFKGRSSRRLVFVVVLDIFKLVLSRQQRAENYHIGCSPVVRREDGVARALPQFEATLSSEVIAVLVSHSTHLHRKLHSSHFLLLLELVSNLKLPSLYLLLQLVNLNIP